MRFPHLSQERCLSHCALTRKRPRTPFDQQQTDEFDSRHTHGHLCLAGLSSLLCSFSSGRETFFLLPPPHPPPPPPPPSENPTQGYEKRASSSTGPVLPCHSYSLIIRAVLRTLVSTKSHLHLTHIFHTHHPFQHGNSLSQA
ncbi:unnamed protein product [Mortierella alpina]